MIRKFVGLFFLLTILVGCGSTQVITKGKDLSSSGVAYTNAMSNLVDVAQETVIDADSQLLLTSRKFIDDETQLKAQIEQSNESLKAYLAELNKFRLHLKLLNSFFINLQALSDSTVQADITGATSELAASIAGLNTSLKGNHSFNFSDDEQTYIGQLTGLWAKAKLADNIKAVFEENHKVIGEALILQNKQLDFLEGVLVDRFNMAAQAFESQNVNAPYYDLTANPNLSAQWSENRKAWINSVFISEQISTAKEAAKQLAKVWQNILSGETDINSLSLYISDFQEFVTTVQKLKDAEDAADASSGDSN